VGDLAHDIHASDRPPQALRLAALAERQWGVVSLAQLRDLGLGRGAVRHRAAVGRLHRLYPGVYAVGHRFLGREARALAAVMACGPGAVLSHASAAAHWDLRPTDAAAVDVTGARSRKGVPGVRLHRPRSLDAQDATTHRGIPVTSVARTLLDVAGRVEAHQLERALAQAERLQLYDRRAIEDVLARANGHRGIGSLRRAIGAEPAFTRSDLEARFLRLVRDAGLPAPAVNAVVQAPDHPRLEVDFLWARERLIVETDGYETHRTRAAFEGDRRRDAALVAAGYAVLRFTWRELAGRPATVVARVTAGCCRACAAVPARAW